jgi:hypothetical protein
VLRPSYHHWLVGTQGACVLSVHLISSAIADTRPKGRDSADWLGSRVARCRRQSPIIPPRPLAASQ